MSVSDHSHRIELALGRPAVSRVDLGRLCSEARTLQVRAVCVATSRVVEAAHFLEASEVKIAALIGLPYGDADADAKRYEAEVAVDCGAHEIELAVNLGRLKDGDAQRVLRGIRDVVEVVDERVVKVAVAADLVTRDELALLCDLTVDSGAQYLSLWSSVATTPVSTSHVFFASGRVGEGFGIKAMTCSGDQPAISALLDAGATLIGVMRTSQGVAA